MPKQLTQFLEELAVLLDKYNVSIEKKSKWFVVF